MTTMWKLIHQLAAPRLYRIAAGSLRNSVAGIIMLATGWVQGFGFA